MTLFGHTFDGVQIASLVSLLMVLVLWIMRFQGDREWTRWFRQWEADRKGRRDAEIAAGNGDTSGSGPRGPRGPWG